MDIAQTRFVTEKKMVTLLDFVQEQTTSLILSSHLLDLTEGRLEVQ